jgi:acetolactate synthase I/II/III large subunit
VSKKMDARAAAISTPDLGAVARAFGCRGQQARTLEQVKAALDDCLAGEGPLLLDIRVSRSVISVPYSRLWFGEDV